jgi:hypothetical protein
MAEPGRIAEEASKADPSPAPPYPIISQRPLDAASRRKLLGMQVGSRFRTGSDIPRTDSHELLVYKVNGKYRPDNGFGLSHEDVVNATHVVVVDMTRDRQVLVELPIASSDSETFRVMVTFTCTVTDPLVVIREGVKAYPALLTYLKSHNKIVQLGLGYPLAEVNEVRIDVDAEIQALATIRPPVLPGMLVSVASVEVAEPIDLAEFRRSLRDLQNTHTLDSARQGYSQDLDQGDRAYKNEMAEAQQKHDLHLDIGRHQHANEMAHTQQDHDYLLAAQEQTHAQILGLKKTQFENALATAQQQHDLALRAKTNAFALEQLKKASSVIGTDPQLALHFAFQAGAMNERELVAGLQTHQDKQHDDDQRRLDREHAIRVFELQWDRETERQKDSESSEEQRFIRGIRAELVRDLIKKGYLDSIDPETLATDLLGELTAGPSAAKPELPGGGGNSVGQHEDPPSVREEDGD